MKLIKKIIVCIVLIIITSACSKEEYITCNINIKNDINNYQLVGTYKIYYNDNYVTKIEKEEKYSSNNKDTIEYLYEYKNLEYYNLNDKYGGFNYKIEEEENIIDLKVNIDLSLVNVINMSDDGLINSDYVNTKGLKLGGIKYFYREKGAVCSE